MVTSDVPVRRHPATLDRQFVMPTMLTSLLRSKSMMPDVSTSIAVIRVTIANLSRNCAYFYLLIINLIEIFYLFIFFL